MRRISWLTGALCLALGLAWAARLPAVETQVLEASGSFEARSGAQYDSPGEAFYDVDLPARGWFRSEVEASPGIFGGPNGNSPFYHFSTQLDFVGDVRLGNFTTTDIEVAPVTTMLSRLIPNGGVMPARVLGPFAISFTFGDFIFGDAQVFTARGFFDPSPVADAGPPVIVEGGASSVLLGSATDADGDPLTYRWTRLFGRSFTLSSPEAAQPSFTAPVVIAPTTTRMQLVASDANSDSVPSTVDVLIYPPGGNIPPLVDAGEGASGEFSTVLMLDGSNSLDFDGVVSLFSWTQTAGPRVDLSDPTSPTPTFKQYDPARTDRTYEFELIASDGLALSAPDTAIFVVEGYGSNAVPLGPNETRIFNGMGAVPEVTQISGDPPETVDFPGVAVPGPGRLRTEVLGSPGLFGGPDGNNPGFHLSSNGSGWDGLGTFGFQQTDIESPPVIANTFFTDANGGTRTLTVIGPQALSFTFLDFLFGRAQSFDVNVWFRPASLAPTALALAPAAAVGGQVIQLDGTGSSDPDGDPLSFSWSQTAGPAAALSNTNAPAPLALLPMVTQPVTLEFTLNVSDGQTGTPDTVIFGVTPPTTGPQIFSATVVELGALDLVVEPGDQILLAFDQPVTVQPTTIQDSDWFINTMGTTFGSGSSVAPSQFDPKTLVITLGNSAAGFVIPGDDPMNSTGIDVAAGNPLGIINPRTELPAVDGGNPSVDDVVVDLKWRHSPGQTTANVEGAFLALDQDQIEFEITRTGLFIPSGAVPDGTQFAFAALPDVIAPSGIVTSVAITETLVAMPFDASVNLVLEYRDEDVDFNAGQIEGLIQPFQITTGGLFPLNEALQSLAGLRVRSGDLPRDSQQNTVTVELDSLDPAGSGEVGTFATLPINPVEERTIHIAPQTGGGATLILRLPTGVGDPGLSSAAGGGYLLHVIEFPGYAETTATDPARTDVKIRTATLLDRITPSPEPGANLFPAQSGAVFVIEARGASGAPVEFTDPVDISVQYIRRNDPALTDTVQFDATVGQAAQMRIVRSRVGSTLGPSYQFIGDSQLVNLGTDVISAAGIADLTDANGLAAWGAIVDPTAQVLTVSELVNHLLEVSLLTGDKFDQADANGDGVRDAADVVTLILASSP